MYAIGCDVGSQSLKGVLVAPDGRIVSQAAAAYPVRYPHPGWAEQDPLDWRRALAHVVGALLADAGVPPGDVATLGLATQVDGLVAVDADGDPLAAAIIWLDRRATRQAAAIRTRGGLDDERIRAITGLNLDASHVAPKIAWFRDTHPDLHERAAGLLLPGSALVAWLTGERVVDHANASSTLLYDITTRQWSPALLDAFGVDPARLGRIAAAHEPAGRLRPEAARALGLGGATTVVVGTGDEHGATLGAGGIVPGIVIDITGTAEPVCVAAATPVIDATGLVETHGHADARVWLVENPGFVSGGAVRWFLDGIGRGLDEAGLDAEAARIPAGSEGVTFLPTLSGSTAPRWNDRARGLVAGLSLHHGRAHLGRALLEGCTFALRDIVDRLDTMDLAGDELRVVGGGARSRFWRQLKADITGRTVRALANDEATATGAAMLAGVAAGTFADLDEAVAALATLTPDVVEPNRSTAAANDDAYGRYRALFDSIEPLWDASTGDAPAGDATPATTDPLAVTAR